MEDNKEGVRGGRQSTISSRQSNIMRTHPGSSTIVTKRYSSGGGGGNRSSMMGLGSGVVKNMSDSGITDIKGNRQREKKDLQDLNERLANYIDKVHFLESQITKLEAENEALRNRKEQDFEPIRAAYDNELAEARKCVDDMGAAKGNVEARLAGLEEEKKHLQDLNRTLENQAKDYRKKIDALNNQVGEYEGELHTLRLRVDTLEDENAKLRELLQKVQDQLRALRSDLEAETAAHIEADCIAQTKTEEAEFYKDLLDEFKLLQPDPVQIKGMDYSDYWKSQMQKAIREISNTYEEKLALIQQDCDAKYESQINSLRNGTAKDGMQLQRAQEEVKKLKSAMGDKNGAYSELATKLASLQAENDAMARRISELEHDLDESELKYDRDVGDLKAELEAVMIQLQTLMDAKMSLELEIACYKKLLEGEESRVGLRNLVESALNTNSKSSASVSLVEALQQQQQQQQQQSS